MSIEAVGILLVLAALILTFIAFALSNRAHNRRRHLSRLRQDAAVRQAIRNQIDRHGDLEP